MNSPPPEWLGIPDVAKEWKVTRRTVENWLTAGLDFQRVNGRRWMQRTDVKAWFARIMTDHPEEKTRRRNRQRKC